MDNSLISMKPTVYALTNLKSCYNRQLSNIESIVEESVGRNRKEMILYTKIMPNFENHVNTGYGISQEYYGGRNSLDGTGQGNKFSGDICHNILCLIIRQLELQNLGITFLSIFIMLIVICSSISFVDDTDLVADGEKAIQNIQQMLNTYNRLHTATGGKIQEEKTKFFYWI